jgi:hypothetical protein
MSCGDKRRAPSILTGEGAVVMAQPHLLMPRERYDIPRQHRDFHPRALHTLFTDEIISFLFPH